MTSVSSFRPEMSRTSPIALAPGELLRVRLGKSGRARVETEFQIRNQRAGTRTGGPTRWDEKNEGTHPILVENLSVPFDRRVWQESRALTDAGYQVTAICPQGTKQDTEREATIDGVRILRYQLRAAAGDHSATCARPAGPADTACLALKVRQAALTWCTS